MSDERLPRMEDKLDKVDEKLGQINVTLAAQHESLKMHMYRTELLEKAIEPIQAHMSAVSGALKLVGFIAVLGGIIESVAILLTYLKS